MDPLTVWGIMSRKVQNGESLTLLRGFFETVWFVGLY